MLTRHLIDLLRLPHVVSMSVLYALCHRCVADASSAARTMRMRLPAIGIFTMRMRLPAIGIFTMRMRLPVIGIFTMRMRLPVIGIFTCAASFQSNFFVRQGPLL